MRHLLLLTPLLTILIATQAFAQRNISYQELSQRADRPNLYGHHMVLPDPAGGTNLIFAFRIDYDLLPFRRIPSDVAKPDAALEYFTTARINMEVLQNGSPVTRHSWADTAWAASFEETRSRLQHLEGSIVTSLQPGEYRLLPVLDRRDSPAARTLSPSPRNRRGNDLTPDFREQRIEIPDLQSAEQGGIVLIDSYDESDGVIRAGLLNYGNAVLYGDDYSLLIHLPPSATHERYHLKVERIRPGSEREVEGEPLFETTIQPDRQLYTDGFTPGEEGGRPILHFHKQQEGWPVILTDIPGSRFPNSSHLITLTAGDEGRPLVVKAVQSRWIEIPVSLLNLDVATDMLRFILDENELREMKRGSRNAREERFRQFWSERDPTPETEFNELMVEYYSRIDQAYERFTTPERPGFDSDQGRTLILYGAPQRTERRYPTGAPTREIWIYPNRTLVFEATSGFGDFRLIREE